MEISFINLEDIYNKTWMINLSYVKMLKPHGNGALVFVQGIKDAICVVGPQLEKIKIELEHYESA